MSFHTSNIGSVGQRAAKLLAVKVGGVKKMSAAQAHSKQSARILIRPRSNHSQSLMAGNFAAL